MAIWILGVITGLSIGWTIAHSTVADECDRMGSFYVGKRDFKCERVER